jgi:hypothetical protein
MLPLASPCPLAPAQRRSPFRVAPLECNVRPHFRHRIAHSNFCGIANTVLYYLK